MIKRFTFQFTLSKIQRVFWQSKFPARKYCIRCHSRSISVISDGRFLCRRCRYLFSILTGTLISRSRLPLDAWYELLWWFFYEFTANKAAKETELPQRLIHHCFSTIRKAIYDYEEAEMEKFFGIVEVDETCIGPKFKNRRKKERGYLKRMGVVKRGRGAQMLLQPVFGMYQRDGEVHIKFISDIDKKTLQDIIRGRIDLESDVYSDTWKSYKGLTRKGYRHETIDHSKEEYVRDEKIHINGIEGFWGYLKERLLKHHGVAKTNLIYYVKEQEFRFNNRHISTEQMIEKIIKIILKSGSSND
ncbi:MAG: IS1595 family transposase [Ignavibacteriales bacterium]